MVVDANAIVRGSWHLDSAPWRLLRYRGRAQLDQLIVPEVVVREVVGQYRAELTKTIEEATRLTNSMRRLRVRAPSWTDIEIEATVSGYEQGLRESLEGARARIEEPLVDVLDLADRAIARRRPFNDKGAGFRDAAVWEHVVHAASVRVPRPVAFISNDGGFGPDGGLHADLLEDLEGRGSGTVRRYRTVDDYIRSMGVSDAGLMAEVGELVEEESAQVGTNIRHALEGMSWQSDYPRAEVTVEATHPPVTVRVVGAARIDSAPQALVDLEIEADADLYVEPWERRERSSYVSGSATLSMSGSVTYDLESKELAGFVVSEPYLDLEDWLSWHDD